MPKPVQEGLWSEGPQGPALLGSCCEDCGAKAFPARRICPGCGSARQAASVLARRGKLYAFTRIFIKSPAIEEIPYTVGYVLLDDGITVPARLQCAVADLKTGLPVVLDVGITGREPAGEEITGYFFRPETGGEAR